MEEVQMNVANALPEQMRRFWEARKLFASYNIKKSGYNKGLNYSYYTEDDIKPYANKALWAQDLDYLFNIKPVEHSDKHQATLTIIDLKDGKGFLEFSTIFLYGVPTNRDGIPTMSEMQAVGASETYARRRLLVNGFNISEPEQLDNRDWGGESQTRVSISKPSYAKQDTSSDKPTYSGGSLFNATEKQMSFLRRLFDETKGKFGQDPMVKELEGKFERKETMTSKEVNVYIDHLKELKQTVFAR